MSSIAPESPDDTLFPGYEPVEVQESAPLSADRRRTQRQADRVAIGVHPLTGGRLHPLASRHRDASSPKDDPFTCGSCWFRELFQPGNRKVAKCTFGLTNEHRYVTDGPRISGSVATDVRAWWPACPEYTPGDRLSDDAARHIPEANA